MLRFSKNDCAEDRLVDGALPKASTLRLEEAIPGTNPTKKRMAFLVPVAIVQHLLGELDSGELISSADIGSLLAMPDVLCRGELHLLGSFIGETRTQVSLPGGTKLRGQLVVLIGEYIGAKVDAVESILRSEVHAPSHALQSLFACMVNPQYNQDPDAPILDAAAMTNWSYRIGAT